MTKVVDAEDSAGITATRTPGLIGSRHIQIFLVFLGMLAATILGSSMAVAVVAMKKSPINKSDVQTFDWDEATKSFILSSFFWGFVVAQIPAGYLATVWSSQKLMAIGLSIAGFFNLILPIGAVNIGNGAIFICVCRVGMGFCQGTILPCTQMLLSKWAPPSERARLGTLAYSGIPLGTVLTMPISGWLAASSAGWPSIFYTCAALSISWSIFYYIFGYDSPSQHPWISEDERNYIECSLGRPDTNLLLEDKNVEKSKIPRKEIFTSKPMWALIIVNCGNNWGFFMLATQIPSYINGVLKLDFQTNGTLSALPYLAMWVMSFPISYLADYALKRGFKIATTRKVCNTIGHWGPGIALVVLAHVPVDNVVLPMTMLTIAVGLNAGCFCGYIINHIDLSPNYAGTMVSITHFISNIVSLLAPVISGAIVRDTTNVAQWQILFYVSAAIYFFGNLIFIIFGRGDIQWWNDPKHINFRAKQITEMR